MLVALLFKEISFRTGRLGEKLKLNTAGNNVREFFLGLSKKILNVVKTFPEQESV